MCGRIDFHDQISFIDDMQRFYHGDIEDHISYDGALPEQTKQLYNLFPTSPIVTLITGDPKKLLKARWGLLPHWTKDINFSAPINARAETIESKPTFKHPFRKQRCVIPINGFYEWKITEDGKIPYYIKPTEDKYLAIKTLKSNPRRVSEKNLFIITFLGGTIGAFSAMFLFRHKIKKMEFLIKFFIVALIQAEVIYVLFKG